MPDKRTYSAPAAVSETSGFTRENSVLSARARDDACGYGSSPSVQVANVFAAHFGFNDTVSGLLEDLWSSAVEYGETLVPGSMNAMLFSSYLFFRLLGGFCYGQGDLIEGIRWSLVAGEVDAVGDGGSFVDGIPSNERELFVGTLGMPEANYRLLRYEVRLQNQLCSSRAPWEYSDDYRMAYNEAMNSQVEESDFRAEWDDLSARMCGKPDFAHMRITISTTLATKLGYGGAANALIAPIFFIPQSRHMELNIPESTLQVGWAMRFSLTRTAERASDLTIIMPTSMRYASAKC